MNNLSNLPPGVTDLMIPGNRPEDAEFENFMEWVWDKFADSALDIPEMKRALLIGIAGVQAEQNEIGTLIEKVIRDHDMGM